MSGCHQQDFFSGHEKKNLRPKRRWISWHFCSRICFLCSINSVTSQMCCGETALYEATEAFKGNIQKITWKNIQKKHKVDRSPRPPPKKKTQHHEIKNNNTMNYQFQNFQNNQLQKTTTCHSLHNWINKKTRHVRNVVCMMHGERIRVRNSSPVNLSMKWKSPSFLRALGRSVALKSKRITILTNQTLPFIPSMS